MVLGELVRIKNITTRHIGSAPYKGRVGIVLDSVEMETGFLMYEVLIDNMCLWFDDIDLENIHEDR